ncbi:MAG: DUF2357 domain-containing protein [Kurthia sp.]|nr:DUF2357 domain-containing protein [Candidatus Kurthia equi]
MDILCKISFSEHHYVAEPITFYKTKAAIDLARAITLHENSISQVLFLAPADSKLKLDSLVYSPKEEHQAIYHFQDSAQYPFTTGYYIGEVHIKEEVYYFPFHIASKIAQEAHDIMVREVEQFSSNLSQTQGYNLVQKSAENIDFIMKNERKFIQAIQQIMHAPKSDLVISYELQAANVVKFTDARSQRYALQHPQQTKVYAPVKKQQYNLLENQLVKMMLTSCQSIFTHYLHEFGATDELLQKTLTRLIFQINEFCQLDWVTDLELPREFTIPLTFFQLPHYQMIYLVHRQLKHSDKQEVAIVERSSKSSAEIYEVWCFIKLVACYEKLGFHIEKHHISFSYTQNTLKFDAQEKNYIELAKGSSRIRLFFEDSISRLSKETNHLSPLYTMHNNLPDCRIDFWQDGQFKGAHLIDFKYRKMEYIWFKAQETNKPNDTLQQLASYALAMQTNSLRLNGHQDSLLDRMPTKEAWALYPFEDHFSNTKLKPYQIRFIPFTPGQENDSLMQQLEEMTSFFLTR